MVEAANGGDIIGLFLAIGIPLFLTFGPIAFSAIFGSYYQKGKMDKLLEREKQTGADPVSNLSKPIGDKKIHSSSLMWESVVICSAACSHVYCLRPLLGGGRQTFVGIQLAAPRAGITRQPLIDPGWAHRGNDVPRNSLAHAFGGEQKQKKCKWRGPLRRGPFRALE